MPLRLTVTTNTIDKMGFFTWKVTKQNGKAKRQMKEKKQKQKQKEVSLNPIVFK